MDKGSVRLSLRITEAEISTAAWVRGGCQKITAATHPHTLHRLEELAFRLHRGSDDDLRLLKFPDRLRAGVAHAGRHYHNRKELPMPATEAILNLPNYRPEWAHQPYNSNIFGTLTCYGMGAVFKEMGTPASSK